jgi:hypothetical protein
MNQSTKTLLCGTIAAAVAVVALALGSMQATAQSTNPVRVRGTVGSLDRSTLVVHSREGADVSIHLADNWAATGIVKASMSDIKPGVFIGTASLPQSDGSLRSLEVVVFPEAARGTGEGHYPWDLKPTSMMTNATVSKAVDSVDGRTVTLSYKGGEQKIVIPSDAPIVTFAEAQKSDVKAGAAVFVPTQRQADGTLSATRVVVGKDGLVPPM